VEEVWTVRLGLVPYEDARRLQRAVEAARVEDRIPDVLLLLEHPPTYTKGRRATPDELPMGEDWYRRQGIDVVDTDRGGRVTYHGPGQLVGYPIVSLRSLSDRPAPASGQARMTGRPTGSLGAEEAGRLGVAAYIRRMEEVIIRSLRDWGVEAGLIDGLTGVWTNPEAARLAGPEETGLPVSSAEKIGSIGVHVSRGITTHGFAINVNNDLQPFEWIVPCGIEACRMSSLARELGAAQDLAAFATTVRDRFGEAYGRVTSEVSAPELEERLGEPLALA
jgi:lipoyl(octanoyl) transferase